MRVMIFGAGRLGAVVADVVRQCGHTVVGFVDVDDSLVGKEIEPGGARVLMNDDEFFEGLDDDDDDDFDAVALAVSDNKVRLRLYFELSESVLVPPFVHPSAVVSSHASIGAASIIMPCAVLQSTAVIGRATIVRPGVVVGAGAKVGDAALLGANSTICAGAAVSERVQIGEGATVMRGVTIGADATLGSSAVLTWDAVEGSKFVAPTTVAED